MTNFIFRTELSKEVPMLFPGFSFHSSFLKTKESLIFRTHTKLDIENETTENLKSVIFHFLTLQRFCAWKSCPENSQAKTVRIQNKCSPIFNAADESSRRKVLVIWEWLLAQRLFDPHIISEIKQDMAMLPEIINFQEAIF